MATLERVSGEHFELTLQGAQVLRLGPREGTGFLFLSRRSRFEPGQAIRGGIPVIFPWFGDDPEGRGRGAHGFARTALWRLVRADPARGHCTLELTDDETTRALWPERFRLELSVRAGPRPEVELLLENRGERPFPCEVALHSYFAVGDAQRATVQGLEGTPYLDKVERFARRVQGAEPIAFGAEVDRVYLGTSGPVQIDDPLLRRRTTIHKRGSNSTIVWNPGPEKGGRMVDLGDQWSEFVCVESGNVADDRLTLAPGARHSLGVSLESEPLRSAHQSA
jgi:glucose-6-phosphate 1-epimerase